MKLLLCKECQDIVRLIDVKRTCKCGKVGNTIKILKKLIDKLEDLKDRPSDAFMNGYNNGLNQAILLLEEKIKQIEAVDE
jgi:hypothetical protein